MIKVNVLGHEAIEMEKGTRLEDISKKYQNENQTLIVAAKVNNILRELTFVLEEDSDIKFIDLNHQDGIRIYQRSLCFIMIRAAKELYDDMDVRIEHSLSKGLYCEFESKGCLAEGCIDKIKERMIEIISFDQPFVKTLTKKEEAIEIFKKHNMDHKVKLMKYRAYEYINIYKSDWFENYFYGYMVPSTGYVKLFDLVPYDTGAILRHPTKYSPQALPEFEESPKIAKIHKEAERWAEILNVGHVGNLDEIIDQGDIGEIIRVAEALHEKKVAQIADLITAEKKRIVLIAGPSSSGKTTFANRLLIQLKVNGLHPMTLSTDDYFVDRTRTPRDENGDYDFESIDAVDVEQFNIDLNKLLKGEAVDLPTFNFQTGEREYDGIPVQITDDQPIIIEGIHGLNEKLTKDIAHDEKYKIYISDLTQLNIDSHNRIPTTDTRLIRRIVRDNRSRGHSARRTIEMWPSVRRGEERNIFPFQECADMVFNSALVYELAALKKHAEPLLEDIKSDEPYYMEAKRLLKFLSYFLSIEDDNLIPYNSILKEFVGGSCFKV